MGSTRKLSSFQQMFYPLYTFYREICQGVIFHLHSLKFKRKHKKMTKVTISSHFWSLKQFGKYEKTTKFSGDFSSSENFLKIKYQHSIVSSPVLNIYQKIPNFFSKYELEILRNCCQISILSFSSFFFGFSVKF